MKKIFIGLAVSFVTIICFLLLIDPYKLTPLQFLPLIATVYLFSLLALYVGITYLSELKGRSRTLVSVILAFTPTILCALMTLGTLSAIDIVLAVTLPSLIAWYAIRVKTN